jgi:hypothetical protein
VSISEALYIPLVVVAFQVERISSWLKNMAWALKYKSGDMILEVLVRFIGDIYSQAIHLSNTRIF